MSASKKIKLLLGVAGGNILNKIGIKNKDERFLSYNKILHDNNDFYDEIKKLGMDSEHLALGIKSDSIDIASLLRNREEHKKIIQELQNKYENVEFYESREEFNKYFNIDQFLALRSKVENKTATAQEINLVATAKKNYLLPAITFEKTEMGENGAKTVTQKGGQKVIAIAFPSSHMFSFQFNKIVFVGADIINDIWASKGINFNKDSSARENLEQLLNYMETEEISDLHIKLYNESMYSYTARQKTKLIKVGGGFANIETTENLINQILFKSNRETQVNDGKEVRSLLVQTLDNGITRNFRFHMSESTYNNTRGKSVSIRRLPREEELKSIEGLGYLPRPVKIIKNVLQKNSDGLIIVSGPTNSGKTTFLNSALVYIRDVLNRRIHRIENPAEVALRDVVTFDLMDRKNSKNPPTLKEFIASIFSQDPDVALIGEARTDEELEIAFELARTGHLALLTEHANDNEAAVARIVDAKGVNKADLNDKLRMGINQHLVGKVCPSCHNNLDQEKENCITCGGTGHIGVLPVYSITVYMNLDPKDDITNTAKLVKENKAIHISKEEILEHYKNEGLIDSVSYNDFVYELQDLEK